MPGKDRSSPYAGLSEVSPHTHVHIPSAAMEQVQALSNQEYVIFNHIFSAKAQLAVIKIIQLGIDTEPVVEIVSKPYAEFPLHGPCADIHVMETLPEVQVKLGIISDAGRAQVTECSFIRFFKLYPEITAPVAALDIVENIRMTFYLHAVSHAQNLVGPFRYAPGVMNRCLQVLFCLGIFCNI